MPSKTICSTNTRFLEPSNNLTMSQDAEIWVAKSAFRGSTHALSVVRGGSTRPLYVTTAGIPAVEAADALRQMNGGFREPTLLQRVDRLCRDTLERMKP